MLQGIKFTKAHAEQIRNALRQDLNKQLPRWRLLRDYISPHGLVEDPNSSRNSGKGNARKIIKNKARRSLRVFVSGMCNGATPSSRPWYNFITTDPSISKFSSVTRYTKACEAVTREMLAVSNFYRIMPLIFRDIGTFSNSAFAMLPHPRYGFYFYPYAVGTYAFSCDADGDPNIFTRDFTLTVKQVVERYGQVSPTGHINWSNFPGYIKNAWEKGNYLQTVNLSNLITPNYDYDPLHVYWSMDRKFRSYVWITGVNGNNTGAMSSSGFRDEAGANNENFISVKGHDYFPVIIPRWDVTADHDYGVSGPGDIALEDTMELQELELYRLDALAKNSKPPMLGHSSLRRHQSSILPGSITYLDDAGFQVGFKPAFQINTSIGDLIASQQECERAISEAFFEDLFLQLSSERKISHVTARETDERAAERLSAITPVLGYIDRDLGSKVLDNALIIAESQKRLPPKPRELVGKNIRPDYISTLAQAAKASMISSLDRFNGRVANMAQMLNDPALLGLIKGEEMIRAYAEYDAIDPNLIRDEKEFADIRQLVSQAEAQQAEAARMQQAAATAKDLSSAKTDGNNLLSSMVG